MTDNADVAEERVDAAEDVVDKAVPAAPVAPALNNAAVVSPNLCMALSDALSNEYLE
jgi:hypothetical protein